MTQNRGHNWRGEFSSADASGLTAANSAMTVYLEGATVAHTVAGTEAFYVTDLLVSAAAALTVNVYSGANNAADAGEVIFTGVCPANTSLQFHFDTPAECLTVAPKVKTSGAGQVYVQARGFMTR